jgi:hypothetical protein
MIFSLNVLEQVLVLYLLQVFSMYNIEVIAGYEEYIFSVTEKEAYAAMP